MSASALRAQSGPRLGDFIATRRIEPFGDMPYVHFVGDGSLGYGWRLTVPPVESIDGAVAQLARSYDALLRILPADHSLDLYIGRDRAVSDLIERYAARPANHPFVQEMIAHTVARWRAARNEGFIPDAPALNFYPRRQAAYLFLKTAPQPALTRNSARSLLAWALRGPGRTVGAEIAAVAHEFRRRITQLEQTAVNGGLVLRRLDAAGFVRFVGGLFFPQNAARADARPDAIDEVGEAIGALGEVISLDGESMVTAYRGEQVVHKAVSMMWAPGEPHPGMLASLVDNETDFWLYLSFRAMHRAGTLAMLKASRHMTDKLTTPFTRIESERRAEALDELQSRLHDGDAPGRARLAVWVQGKDETDATDRAVRVVGKLDAHMSADIETRIGPSVLLQSTPLARHELTDRVASRARRVLSSDAASLAPIGGYWEGTDPNRSIAMYASRWGTPFCFDPRICDTNPHLCVVGGSGSGKTFWVQDFLMQLYCVPDLYVFLISIKPDYERLARILGQYVEISLDGEVAINGFAGAPTHDNLSVWLNLIVNMLRDDRSNTVVTKDEQGLLSEKLMVAARKNWNHQENRPLRETLLEHIIAELRTTELGRTLAQRLHPYHRGPYAGLFNRPSSLRLDERFIFFNLSKVLGYQCAGPLSLVVFNFVNTIMYDPKHAHILKVVGLDEGWALTRDEGSAALATNGFRAYRSLNGMAFAISQRMADFDSAMGQAILANTATKIVLRQSHDSALALPNYLPLSEAERKLLTSLQIRRGYFSEFFVKMEGQPSTVARVIPDPLRYAVATTDPADTVLYNQLVRACGHDHIAAVRRFAKEHPYGGRRTA